MMSITIFPRQKTDSAICGGSINAPPLVIPKTIFSGYRIFRRNHKSGLLNVHTYHMPMTISPREKIVLSQAAQLMLIAHPLRRT